MNEIIPFYKPLGLTPLQAIKKLQQERPELKTVSITYAGRLDPMATGLLLLLAGDAVHQKEFYQNLDKDYSAEVLFGFQTDSFDILGLASSPKTDLTNLTNQQVTTISPQNLQNAVQNLVGQHRLPYPPYSSKPVNGQPLWLWAQFGQLDQIKIPTRIMEISSAKLIHLKTELWTTVYQNMITAINLVDGKFRQQEILSSWAKLNQKINPKTKVQIATIKFSVKSGTYIRTLASLLGERLESQAILLSLDRTKIGAYQSPIIQN